MSAQTLAEQGSAPTTSVAEASPQDPAKQSPKIQWQYGGFFDVGYLIDFNHPVNDLFRSRGTTFHVDEVDLNMAGVYLRKQASAESRWGMELTAQGGKDSEVFGFSATAPNLPGYKVLRHFGPTDVSYLAPIGKGLTVQAGIFNSFIGYDALYAKDNFNYTRPWGADFTPYLMMGVNATYPFSDRLSASVFLVNGYWHLADANHVPSWGGQIAYRPTDHWSLKQTVLVGPHQSNTAFEFWRVLSDSIVEWKKDPLTVAVEYQGATEKVATAAGSRAVWMIGQLPVHWAIDKRWAVTVRPEVAWDRNGRWTTFAQTVEAVTSTIEYRIPYKQSATILRVEHRFDSSHGPAGGFYTGGFMPSGAIRLTPNQHLLVFGAIFTFDGHR